MPLMLGLLLFYIGLAMAFTLTPETQLPWSTADYTSLYSNGTYL